MSALKALRRRLRRCACCGARGVPLRRNVLGSRVCVDPVACILRWDDE